MSALGFHHSWLVSPDEQHTNPTTEEAIDR
jgi:hypothetical protein